MSTNEFITEITGSTTISFSLGVYIINISADATITLPSIVSDGIRLTFFRRDGSVSSNATLTATGPNLIYSSSITSSSTYLVSPKYKIELVSYGGNWQVNYSVVGNATGFNSTISGVLVGNSTSPYATLTGSSSQRIFNCYNFISPSVRRMEVSIQPITPSAGLAGDFWLKEGNFVDFMKLSISGPFTVPVVFFTETQLVYPVTGRIYVIWIPTAGGANDKFGLLSIKLY